MRKMLALFLTFTLLLAAAPTVFAADASYSVGQGFYGVDGIVMEWNPATSAVRVYIDKSWWNQAFNNPDGGRFFVYCDLKQTNDEPTSFSPEQPTDLTAFGDLDLHEYLLSLNPDKVYLGSEKEEPYSGSDQYYYADRYLKDTIADKLKEMYPSFRIDKTAGIATMEFYGTRVETSYNNEHYIIQIESFYGAGEQFTNYILEF